MGLLILARKERHGEDSVTITVPPSTEPRTIEVVVTKIDSAARLGFRADKDIRIMRTELLDAA